jgi:hypothetical protein
MKELAYNAEDREWAITCMIPELLAWAGLSQESIPADRYHQVGKQNLVVGSPEADLSINTQLGNLRYLASNKEWLAKSEAQVQKGVQPYWLLDELLLTALGSAAILGCPLKEAILCNTLISVGMIPTLKWVRVLVDEDDLVLNIWLSNPHNVSLNEARSLRDSLN